MVSFWKSPLIALAAFPVTGQAIEIDLRYDYDNNGFFNQPGAKEALRACADFFEAILTDELAEINATTSGNNQNTWTARPQHPTNGGQLSIVDLVVPEDTLVIYVGARNLSGSTAGFASTGYSWSGFQTFGDVVEFRGQSGASASVATDFGPWGGSISFDTTLSNGSPRVWNFSLTESDPTKTDFVGISLHEFCHLLGIGAADSWDDRIGNDSRFQGVNAVSANEGTAPLVTGDQGHWAVPNDGSYQSPTLASFSTPHGENQRLIMNAFILNDGGNHNVLTDLDLAALIDIGWEVTLPADGEIEVANGQVTFTVPTNTGFSYRLLQGGLGGPFIQLGNSISGDGSFQNFTTPLAPSGKDFFRFAVSQNSSASPAARSLLKQPVIEIQSGSWSWQSKDCCAHD